MSSLSIQQSLAEQDTSSEPEKQETDVLYSTGGEQALELLL
jgi:hypothetical protein